LFPNSTSCSSLVLQIQLNWKHVPRQCTIQQSIQNAAAPLGSLLPLTTAHHVAALPLTAAHHAAAFHPHSWLHTQLLDKIFSNKTILLVHLCYHVLYFLVKSTLVIILEPIGYKYKIPFCCCWLRKPKQLLSNFQKGPALPRPKVASFLALGNLRGLLKTLSKLGEEYKKI
jgi:hypothetical protein